MMFPACGRDGEILRLHPVLRHHGELVRRETAARGHAVRIEQLRLRDAAALREVGDRILPGDDLRELLALQLVLVHLSYHVVIDDVDLRM